MSWGLGLQLKIALGIWAAFFCLGVIPVAILNDWKVGTLPVVEGTLSNHHVVETKFKRQTILSVKATLEFDGPLGYCKHNEVATGTPNKPESFAAKVQVAVRKDSCHGYYLLPHQSPSALEWLFVFLFIGFVATFVISFTYWLERYQRVQQVQ
jgi:hypothetical protein